MSKQGKILGVVGKKIEDKGLTFCGVFFEDTVFSISSVTRFIGGSRI